MANPKASDKAALLIYCTRGEAAQIKLAAKRERRTIPGFVMNAVMTRFAVEGRLRERREEFATHGREQAEVEQTQVELRYSSGTAGRGDFPALTKP